MKRYIIIIIVVALVIIGCRQPQEPDSFTDSIYWRGITYEQR